MAEALGIASSVIAVVDLSAKVINWCVRYAQDVSHAREEKKMLVDEATRLNLASVNARELLCGPHGSRLKASHALYLATVNSQSQLRRIESQLAEGSGQGNISFEALKWPFKSKDVQSVIQDLHRCTKAIYSALEIDQTLILLDLDHKIALDTLPIAEGASFDSHAEEHNPTCLQNTRVELLEDVCRWIDGSNSKSIFWLNGMAGTGKSTISRTIAQMRRDRGDLGASFFFKRETGRGNLAKFVPTLARQLGWSIPGVAPFIKNAIDADPAIADKTVREQFQKLIREPLSKAAATPSTPSSVVMVIDALDECEREANIRLLINILSQTQICRPRLRVFLTSRPDLPVRLGFGEVQGTYQDLVLHEIPVQVVEHDISVFLTDEFRKIRDSFNMTVGDERKLPSDWPGQQTLNDLAQMSVPLFIFAATVCRFVSDRRWNPQTRLRKVLDNGNKSQGSQLDQTYGPILRSQITEVPKADREGIIKDFRVIVGSIVTLASPLSVTTLSRLLDVSPDVVDERLDALHSALSIPLERTLPVRLLHLSFRDYLITERSEFWVDEKLTHRNLAKHCLQLMRSALRENICELSFPGMRRSAVGVRQLEEHIPPELQYACMYWIYHQTEVDFELNDSDEDHEFLTTHFLHWVEALSFLGHVKECLDSLKSLARWLENRKDSSLSILVADAIQFLEENFSVIAEAPLQIYSSSLIFAPKTSIIRKTFESRIPEWLTIWPRVREDWGACLLNVQGNSEYIWSVIFSSGTSASYDEVERILDAQTGMCEHLLEGHSNSVNLVVFSHDTTMVASASYDKTVRIWDAKTGECERVLGGHSDGVESVVFSHDSKRVASASYDKTIRIWNAETGKCEHVLEGHIGPVHSAVFSHDSTMVASASYDKTVRIWDARTGTCRGVIPSGSSHTTILSFTPDKCGIVTGNGVFTFTGDLVSYVEPLMLSPPSVVPALGLRDKTWVTSAGKDLLWLPTECRDGKAAVSADTVVIGCQSGRIVVLGFSVAEIAKL